MGGQKQIPLSPQGLRRRRFPQWGRTGTRSRATRSEHGELMSASTSASLPAWLRNQEGVPSPRSGTARSSAATSSMRWSAGSMAESGSRCLSHPQRRTEPGPAPTGSPSCALPPGSVLGGLTALKYDDFKALRVDTPVVVRHRRLTDQSTTTWTMHWSKFLDERDVHPAARAAADRAGQECPRRCLVDRRGEARSRDRTRCGTAWCRPHPSPARALVRRRRLSTSRPDRRVPTWMRAGGIQSLPEQEFDQIRLEAQLPRPERQAVRAAPQQPLLPRCLVEEVQPGLRDPRHSGTWMSRQWDGDLLRLNEVTIDGTSHAHLQLVRDPPSA